MDINSCTWEAHAEIAKNSDQTDYFLCSDVLPVPDSVRGRVQDWPAYLCVLIHLEDIILVFSTSQSLIVG